MSVHEVVGAPLCVAASDGERVYKRLAAALTKECKVVLTFRNVTALTAAFLNTAVGQLYGKFDEEKIRELLSVRDIEKDDLVRLKLVVDTAKAYYKDPTNVKKILREA